MQRRNKALLLLSSLLIIILAVVLVLFALRQNTNLFYTPHELVKNNVIDNRVRLGGFVKASSLVRLEALNISFTITDNIKDIKVIYNGILPDLFREGQGVVALGKLTKEGIFIADQILAKHDENYRPPELTNVA